MGKSKARHKQRLQQQQQQGKGKRAGGRGDEDLTSNKRKPAAGAGQRCPHLRQASVQALRKPLQAGPALSCIACLQSASPHEPQQLWICLSCGQANCGRNDREHGEKHSRSSRHALVLSPSNFMVWCYVCDQEIPVQPQGGGDEDEGDEGTSHGHPAYKKVEECVAFVRAALSKEDGDADDNEDGGGKKKGKPQQQKKKGDDIVLSGEQLVASFAVETKRGKTGASNGGFGPGLKGLRNLGNTCFFNSILQNLAHSKALKNYFVSGLLPRSYIPSIFDKEQEDQEREGGQSSLVVKGEGKLTSALRAFMIAMYTLPGSCLTPKALFSAVCQQAARFRGYRQQDSQELLRYLLDGIRTEEVRRLRLLQNSSKSSEQEDSTIAENEKEEEKQEEKQEENKAGDDKVETEKEKENKKERDPLSLLTNTFVDAIFGGVLESTITCHTCHHVSKTYEPFLDLSVPIPSRFCEDTRTSGRRSRAAVKHDTRQGGILYSKKQNAQPPRLSKREMKRLQQQQSRKAAAAHDKRGVASNASELTTLSNKNEEEKKQEGEREEGEEERKEKKEDEVKPQQNGEEESEKEAIGKENIKKDEDTKNEAIEEDEQKAAKEKNNEDKETEAERETTNKKGTVEKEKNKEKDKTKNAECSFDGRGTIPDDIRQTLERGDLSIYTCLYDFTNPELLEEDNSFACPECTRKAREEKKKEQEEEVIVEAEKQRRMKEEEEKRKKQEEEEAERKRIEEEEKRRREKEVEEEQKRKEEEKRNNEEDEKESEEEQQQNGATEENKVEELAKDDKEEEKKEKGNTDENATNETAQPQHSAQKTKATTATATKPKRLAKRTRGRGRLTPTAASSTRQQQQQTATNKGKEKVVEKEKKEEELWIKTTATKQFLIHRPPPVLTLHLKRFRQTFHGLDKQSKHVGFPLELSLGPFIASPSASSSSSSSSSSNEEDKSNTKYSGSYRLFGVVEHSGGLGGGHYVAYVRSAEADEAWWYFSDSQGHSVDVPKVLSTQAYLLFYERCEKDQ